MWVRVRARVRVGAVSVLAPAPVPRCVRAACSSRVMARKPRAERMYLARAGAWAGVRVQVRVRVSDGQG